MVGRALADGGFSCHFSEVPSAADDPEPTVVREGPFERLAALPGGEERGRALVRVLVVREQDAEAEAAALAREGWLRSCGWERRGRAGRWRAAGLDTTAPAPLGRDGSGRFVWGFDAELTLVREAV